MVDFKPDRELESKEFNETLKTNRNPRDIYNSWPTWLKNLAKVLAGIIIIIILVLIGRSIHHHAEQNAKKAGSNPTTASKKTATNPSPSKAGNSGSSSSSPTSGSTTGSSSSSSTTPPAGTSGKSGQIPNTDPGNVAALFMVAVGAGSGAHYVISRRRA